MCGAPAGPAVTTTAGECFQSTPLTPWHPPRARRPEPAPENNGGVAAAGTLADNDPFTALMTSYYDDSSNFVFYAQATNTGISERIVIMTERRNLGEDVKIIMVTTPGTLQITTHSLHL